MDAGAYFNDRRITASKRSVSMSESSSSGSIAGKVGDGGCRWTSQGLSQGQIRPTVAVAAAAAALAGLVGLGSAAVRAAALLHGR